MNTALVISLVLSGISILLSCYVFVKMELARKKLKKWEPITELDSIRLRRPPQETKEESDAAWNAVAAASAEADEAMSELEDACETFKVQDDGEAEVEVEEVVATICRALWSTGTKADVVRQNPVIAVGSDVSRVIVCSPKMALNTDEEDEDTLGALTVEEGIVLSVLSSDTIARNEVEFRLNGQLVVLTMKIETPERT